MTGGNPFLAGELHMFQQGLTPEHIREDARSEAYEEHPCPPARDEEKEGYHTACPSLGARRFWCSGMVNEHTVSHRAVSFSTPGCEYHWTSCRKSSITRSVAPHTRYTFPARRGCGRAPATPAPGRSYNPPVRSWHVEGRLGGAKARALLFAVSRCADCLVALFLQSVTQA